MIFKIKQDNKAKYSIYCGHVSAWYMRKIELCAYKNENTYAGM